MKKVFFYFLLFGLGKQLIAQSSKSEMVSLSNVPQIVQTPEQKNERLQWFRDAKFGMFIHWGPCTVGKKEIGWGRNGNRPWDINKHGNGMRSEDSVYDNYYKQFNPIEYNPTKWIKLAKAAGMKYMVLITKHHDGFSMFDSKESDYDIMASPYRKDIIKQFVDACHKENMKVGLYYSTRDWYHSDYLQGDNKKYDAFYRNQIRELLTNYGKIDIMWFDHVGGKDWTKWRMDSLFKMMYQLQPHLIVNNRAALFIGSGAAAIPSVAPVSEDIRKMAFGDYNTPEGRIGAMDIKKDWESCIHVGEGWSNRGNKYFTPFKDCITMLVSTLTGGGNLLLNFDPTELGSFPEEEIIIANEMGKFTSKYAIAIYGTRAGPYRNGSWGGSTHKDNKMYLFIKSWDNNEISLSHLPYNITKVNFLNSKKAVEFIQSSKQVTFKTTPADRDSLYTVLELTTEQTVSDSLLVGSRASIFSDEITFGNIISSVATASFSSIDNIKNNSKHNLAFLNGNPIASDYAFATTKEKNPFVIIDLKDIKNTTGIALTNVAGAKYNGKLVVSVSIDSTSWQKVYSGSFDKDYWEIPFTELKTGAEIPGKQTRYIKVEVLFEEPTMFQLRKAEVFGK